MVVQDTYYSTQTLTIMLRLIFTNQRYVEQTKEYRKRGIQIESVNQRTKKKNSIGNTGKKEV